MTDDRLARAALSRLVEPGEPRVVRLLADRGVTGLLEQLSDKMGDLGHEVAGRAARLDAERDLSQAERLGIRFVIPGDDEWPASVDDLAHLSRDHRYLGVPIGLWVRGPLRLTDLTGAVAVVGSRDSTTYGESVAREIGAGVARAGRCVVSGAAFGIDQAAHRGALAVEGRTIAVLACGVDRAYPSAHRELLDAIGAVGAIVSEVPPGTAPTRLRFLARNRVIAALTTGTVVVEAAVRSGALNTAKYAVGLSRSLMGVPGPVTSAQSEGVHQQITRGAASLVTGAADVLEVVGRAGEHLQEPKRAPETPRDRLALLERRVLEAVPVFRSARAEAIATTAGVGLERTRLALGGLAVQGFVTEERDGWRLDGRSRPDVPEIAGGDAYDR